MKYDGRNLKRIMNFYNYIIIIVGNCSVNCLIYMLIIIIIIIIITISIFALLFPSLKRLHN